jgi:hypothetical protein
MLALDSDLLAILHIFKADARFEATRQFFQRIKDQPKAITIFTLLELCGIVATSTGKEDAGEIFHQYISSDDSVIIYPDLLTEDTDEFWGSLVSESFLRMQRGMRLGDAAILWALETNREVDTFVTWNTKHFKGKTSLKILTPPEFF